MTRYLVFSAVCIVAGVTVLLADVAAGWALVAAGCVWPAALLICVVLWEFVETSTRRSCVTDQTISWYEHRAKIGALEDTVRALEEEVALQRRKVLEWNTRAVEERARAERAEASLRSAKDGEAA